MVAGQSVTVDASTTSTATPIGARLRLDTELKDALTELLAGKPITAPESECQGCLIVRAKQDGSNNRVR